MKSLSVSLMAVAAVLCLSLSGCVVSPDYYYDDYGNEIHHHHHPDHPDHPHHPDHPDHPHHPDHHHNHNHNHNGNHVSRR